MSVASSQCHLLSITARKADLEFRLLQLTNEITRLSCKSAALNEELMGQMPDMESKLLGVGSKNVEEAIEIMLSDEFYVAYQTQMSLVNTKEKILETEKQQIETQLNALNTMEEGVQKQIESGLKKAVLQV